MMYEPVMYEMLVSVHDSSCEIPGQMSKKILRQMMRIGWMSQAPGKSQRERHEKW
jgi:hypothetical protein